MSVAQGSFVLNIAATSLPTAVWLVLRGDDFSDILPHCLKRTNDLPRNR